MSMDAVALLRIPSTKLTATNAGDSSTFRTADGTALPIRALPDATMVFTKANFASEPDELGAAIRKLVGAVLDQHDDARGIYVFPERRESQGERLRRNHRGDGGDCGFWVPRVAADYVPKARPQTSRSGGDIERPARDDPAGHARCARGAVQKPGVDAFTSAASQMESLLAMPGMRESNSRPHWAG